MAIQSRTNPNFKLGIQAYVLKTLTSIQPSDEFDVSSFAHIRDRNDLADPSFNIPAPIDLILGMPDYDSIMSYGNTIPGKRGQPTAYQSRLGFVIMGVRGSSLPRNHGNGT